jgi:hypothetical protein
MAIFAQNRRPTQPLAMPHPIVLDVARADFVAWLRGYHPSTVVGDAHLSPRLATPDHPLVIYYAERKGLGMQYHWFLQQRESDGKLFVFRWQDKQRVDVEAVPASLVPFWLQTSGCEGRLRAADCLALLGETRV